VILIDRLGPDILSKLRMKGHVLHRAQAHLKVLGCSLVWTPLTKKLQVYVFFRVRMKSMEVAKRFYRYLDHFEFFKQVVYPDQN